jgi:transposase
MELPIVLDLASMIPPEDISRTVLAAVSESGVYMHVANNGRDSNRYDCQKMLKAVILANTLLGQASVREMEDMCRNDIRFPADLSGWGKAILHVLSKIHT